ncbi:MAG: DUF2061 domain-containing protein [Candidatus Omnitrophota bacterium]
MEQHKRTICKTVTWRGLGACFTIALVYLYSGSIKESFAVGFLVELVKMGLYYMHERIWNRSSFGRPKQQPEYQI